ncbi:MAG: type II toxin-antitoxin system RelE/ParE family toxin [Promethearchaeota archaeon]
MQIYLFPHAGRKVPEFENYGYRELIRKGFRIVYRIKEESNFIEILAIVQSSRDMKRISFDE